MSEKVTIEFVRQAFFEERYELLTKEYKNQTQKLEYICPNGHRRYTTWKNWKRGRRCLICKNHSTKPSIDTVRKSFEREGYTLLSTEYKTNKTKLDYICSNGHNNSITWADWNIGGYRCPDCANNKRLSIDKIIMDFNSEDYTFISGKYRSNTSPLIIKCPKGHEFETSRVKWTTGNRCPKCYTDRVNIDVIRESFAKEGYKLLTDKYDNAYAKLDYICPLGHKHKISWASWKQGSRCYYCSKSGTSLQEQELISFIKALNIDIEVHDRYLISPIELDIVIPSKKIAIEYCGLYWHSELQGKDRSYHLNKLNRCNEIGYRLVTIFEDEFLNNKDIIFSRLQHIIGCNTSNVIYARSCIIKEIQASEASSFCNRNHLQGYTGSSIKLGAYYNRVLVSVMTFAKPSISKGKSFVGNNGWELSRFCVDKGFRITGIASKLLKYFKLNYSWNIIFSYADRRWSDGNVYSKLGFDYSGLTPANYWYFKNGDIKRHHRFALRKKSDEPKDITEWELRKAQGWNRIWDCGNLKYVMYNE